MEAAPYIDIHTHLPCGVAGHIAIKNHIIGHDAPPENEGVFFSAGIHPAYLREDQERDLYLKMAGLLHHQNLLALGEAGLDRICGTDMDLQKRVFGHQIDLAAHQDLPLIIHQIRAAEDTIQLLRKYKFAAPVIFHGYNNRPAMGQRLLDAGYFLSFGAAITHRSMPAAAMLALTPADRFFLETDTAPVDIRHLYARAAEIRQISTDALKEIIFANFKQVFTRYGRHSLAGPNKTTHR